MAASQTLIIVNPNARVGDLGDRWKGLERELLEALGETSARVVFTSPEDHGAGIARKALKEGTRKIVVVGGDGTVSEVVQGFFENARAIAPDATLVIMPAGRGDDFFKAVAGSRSHYSSREAWSSGLKLLRSGSAKPCDVGHVDFIGDKGVSASQYFINIASFGYPGLVVKNVVDSAGTLLGKLTRKTALTYVLQSALGLAQYKPIRTEVKIDGKVFFDGPVFSGFVLNGRYNAGGACWGRNAEIDDGLFHVLITEPRDPFTTVITANRMFSGQWDGVKKVHPGSGKVVEVMTAEFDDRRHPLFEIDGDLPEPRQTKGARFEILPGAIRVWR